MHLRWFVLALCLLHVDATGGLIAQQWSADMTIRGPAVAGGGGVYTGAFFYDRVNQRYRMRNVMPLSFFKKGQVVVYDTLFVNATGFNANATVGTGDDSVCKASSSPYGDPFVVLANASSNGSMVVDGHHCEIFVGQNPTTGTSFLPGAKMSICIDDEGAPREWNATLHSPIAGGIDITYTYALFNVTTGAKSFTNQTYAVSEACATRYPTAPCPRRGVETLDLYRIHSSSEPKELANRNLGDALGDMGFMCEASTANSTAANLVSWWTVEADNAWGQYAYCLYTPHQKNECFGGTGRQIGRESTQGMGSGHLQGQCSANADVGSWYSMPAAGECAPGKPVGTDGCTWRARRLRTVHASCILRDRGLLDVCKKEVGHAPFTKSAEIFVKALASSDPAAGGCPDAELDEAIII